MEANLSQEFTNYMKDLNKQGVVLTKCECSLNKGLITTEPVNKGDVLLEYPLAISVNANAIMKSDIAPLVEAHPELYKQHVQATYLLFTTYLLRQAVMQNDSPMHNYLMLIGNIDLLFNWKDSELTELQDEFLKSEAIGFEREVQNEWEAILKVLKYYPHLFPPATYDYQLYKRAYQIVISKLTCNTFNEPMLLPLIDNIKRGIENSEIVFGVYNYAGQSQF